MNSKSSSQLAHFRDLPVHTRLAASFAVLSAHGPVTEEMALAGADVEDRQAVDSLKESGVVQPAEGGWRITAAAQTDVVLKVDIAEATSIVEERVGIGG